MHRLALVLVFAVACRSASPGAGASGAALNGAATPRAAVQRFLDAAQGQDLQAIGTVWGDENGLARDKMQKQELERREIIMICLLNHAAVTVADPQPSERGRMTLLVNLTQGTHTATSKFTVARGASGRWYVQDLDLVVLENSGFCPSKK